VNESQGIEQYNGKPYISTVGCDNYADWSIYPVDSGVDGEGEFTIEVRREGDKNGKGLWVYWIKGEERVPLREIAWFFGEEEDWNISVGALVARPATAKDSNGEDLEVKFWGFEIDTQ